ncbi:MAG: HNH endonuclease [Phycisphaerales bacterium]|nr:HNH endonuclease [Phycisphaerales bacterium]
MPAIRPHEIVSVLLDAFQQSGATAVFTPRRAQHPRVFVVTDPAGPMVVCVYIWTLTHGGRPSLPDEYRIQMTSVESPLTPNPEGATALLGYEPNLRMFAGFDLSRHKRFTTGSPSVQIDIKVVLAALQAGLAFDRKDNDEIAVGVRPDQLLAYINNAAMLHTLGPDGKTFKLLTRATAPEPVPAADLSRLSVQRRRIVETMSRLSRSANFRDQVLTAYDHRCAVTRMQLRLVEAAHILPVVAEMSPDHVTNGLALSSTYHRAFDSGLIYLNEGYEMCISAPRRKLIVDLGLDGGLADFEKSLGKIHLPPDKAQWPNLELVQRANKLRMVG